MWQNICSAKYALLIPLPSFAQVPNVLVVGHSRCGGIQALMSMKSKDDSGPRSFIRDWVSIGKSARLSTEAAAGNLNFELQCRHCEKESINSSLLNLLTYPWIEKRVNEGTLSLHGGYYNFVDCTFEKWTLVYRQGLEGGSKYAIKNRSTWSWSMNRPCLIGTKPQRSEAQHNEQYDSKVKVKLLGSKWIIQLFMRVFLFTIMKQ